MQTDAQVIIPLKASNDFNRNSFFQDFIKIKKLHKNRLILVLESLLFSIIYFITLVVGDFRHSVYLQCLDSLS